MSNKFPKKLYKFIRRSFVDDMLKKGVLRIGTAKEFRKCDGTEGGRADANELKMLFKIPDGPLLMSQDHPYAIALGLKIEKPVKANFQNVTVNRIANGFLYSTSLKITNNLKQRTAAEFQADACVCISDVPGFIGALATHPLLNGRGFIAKEVSYMSAERLNEFREQYYLHKHFKYGWQHEFRIVWEGEATDDGQIIEAPEATPFLSRIF